MQEKFDFAILSLIIGTLGGVANWLMSDEHKFFQFIVSVFLAGFVAVLMGALCQEFGYTERITFFVCGVSGVAARPLLEMMKRILLHKIGGSFEKMFDVDTSSNNKSDK